LYWIQRIVRASRDMDIPVFVKQLGAKPFSVSGRNRNAEHLKLKDLKGSNISEFPKVLQERNYPINTTDSGAYGY